MKGRQQAQPDQKEEKLLSFIYRGAQGRGKEKISRDVSSRDHKETQ